MLDIVSVSILRVDVVNDHMLLIYYVYQWWKLRQHCPYLFELARRRIRGETNMVEGRKENALIFKNTLSLYASHSYGRFYLVK
jgi:hypothetical protein